MAEEKKRKHKAREQVIAMLFNNKFTLQFDTHKQTNTNTIHIYINIFTVAEKRVNDMLENQKNQQTKFPQSNSFAFDETDTFEIGEIALKKFSHS